MQFVVSVEQSDDRGFIAQSPLAPGLTAEAPTVEQAVSQLHEQITTLVAGGGLLQIEVPLPPGDVGSNKNPWQAVVGMFENEPLFDEVLEHMKAYREQRNTEMDEIPD